MSWCTANYDTPTRIRHATQLRTQHQAKPTWRGKRCATCHKTWGRHGCPDYLWATDYLSTLSRIILPNPPPRPKSGKHRETYIHHLTTADKRAQHTIQTQLHAQHQPTRPTRGRHYAPRPWRPLAPAH